jgi:hypothetical protein
LAGRGLLGTPIEKAAPMPWRRSRFRAGVPAAGRTIVPRLARKKKKKNRRERRTRSIPPGNDQQTQIEAELVSSGRSGAVPRERLFGPHEGRLEATAARNRREHGDTDQPIGPGADVAPTKLAQARERERHRLERELGRTPAGEDGTVRGRRAPGVTRDALREAAAQADRNIIGHRVTSRSR